MSTIYDNLNQNVGVLLNGTVTGVRIAWPTFTAQDGSIQAGRSVQLPIDATGILSYSLVSNSGALSPSPALYTFTFTVLLNGVTPANPVYYSAQAVVPNTNSLLGLADCVLSGAAWLQPLSSGSGGNGGSGGSSASELNGTASTAGVTIPDGTVYTLPQACTIVGASVGQIVSIASTPALPSGVQVIGKVTNTNTVLVELWNLSAQPITLASTVFSVIVFQR